MKFAGTTVLAGVAAWLAIDVYLAITIPYVVPGASAATLFQWDASNFYGDAAFRGGLAMIIVGLAADLIVSLLWATLWVWSVTSVRAVGRHQIVFAALFGIVVMFVMRFLVVPLGAAHASPFTIASFVNQLAAHVVFFGVPLGVVTMALSKRSDASVQ